MLKRHRKYVCGRVCTKSFRLILESYSEYLVSQGFSIPWYRRCVRAVEHFGRWIGRRKVCRPLVQEFLDKGLSDCRCPGASHNRRLNRAALNHLLAM